MLIVVLVLMVRAGTFRFDLMLVLLLMKRHGNGRSGQTSGRRGRGQRGAVGHDHWI